MFKKSVLTDGDKSGARCSSPEGPRVHPGQGFNDIETTP